MPAISLVVCLYNEREYLERLLEQSRGIYDDLVVVHDGPDNANIRELVEQSGGRFFEGPRAYQQEPHWPFAWGEAKYDWILRLDADEFPSTEMKQWLQDFRKGAEPEPEVTGYTCIWPIWNGKRALSDRWPTGRQFLFQRQRVRFFGMVEQTPIPDGSFIPLPLILHHQPKRCTYGIGNLLFRSRMKMWFHVIAKSLLGKPTDLPCWRWTSDQWPSNWEELRRHPLRTGFKRLLLFPAVELSRAIKKKHAYPFSLMMSPGIHHFMLGLTLFREQKRARR